MRDVLILCSGVKTATTKEWRFAFFKRENEMRTSKEPAQRKKGVSFFKLTP
jgi:hypothetical protein